MNKQQQCNTWYFVGAFLLLLLFQSVWTTYRTVEPIPYSDFVKFLNEGRIADVTVHQEQITGRLKEPVNGGSSSPPIGLIPHSPSKLRRRASHSREPSKIPP